MSDYGRWVSDGSYGNVWVPSGVAPGWAPYRYGRWVWEDYYGWTWIGAEPWGWAPYHYGNWYHSPAYGWCWYPAFGAVPVWRPALVAFFSFGSGGWGFGNIGWVPLAPFEPFHPWWGPHYYNTVTNITNVTNTYYGPVGNGSGEIVRYANAGHNGATAIGAKRFSEGRFEHPQALGTAQLGRVAIARGPLPVVPSEANLRFKPAGALAPQPLPRRALVERSFAGHALPVTRTPFEQQRTALAGVAHPRTAPAGPTTIAPPPAKNVVSPWTRFAPRVVPGSDPWSRFGRVRGNANPAPGTMTTTTTTTTGGAVMHPGRAVPGGGSRVVRPATTTTTPITPTHAAPHGAGERVHPVTRPPN